MKVLKTAAIVVGVVAIAATGIGAIAGAGIIGTTVAGVTTVAGISAATFTAIGSVASLASLAISTGIMVAGRKPRTTSAFAGNPEEFKLNPDAPVPYAIGRTIALGSVVFA